MKDLGPVFRWEEKDWTYWWIGGPSSALSHLLEVGRGIPRKAWTWEPSLFRMRTQRMSLSLCYEVFVFGNYSSWSYLKDCIRISACLYSLENPHPSFWNLLYLSSSSTLIFRTFRQGWVIWPHFLCVENELRFKQRRSQDSRRCWWWVHLEWIHRARWAGTHPLSC